jgi:hypothetical protein
MASTYSDLKIELIGTGEQVGTWGATTNTNLGTAIEDAITGSANVSFSSADVTLTLTNTNGSQTARNLRLVCTGTSGGARNLILGSGCQINKLYLVQNDLADAVTVKNTTGTGVAIPAGGKKFVFNNGTNVIEATTGDIVNLATGVTGTLPVANGGTGAATLTGVVKGNGTSAFTAGTVDLASEVTGTLPIANGGTGATTNTQARTNLDVPSRSGADASGTWGINISGSAATWTTARNLSIGGTSKSVNGSTDVTWTTSEIGINTSNVLSATAGAAFEAVGTYCWLVFSPATASGQTEGTTYAGSSLFPGGFYNGGSITADSNNSNTVNATRSPNTVNGTWRLMGRNNAPGTLVRYSLFLRIS